jgi:hypothetical protein
MSAVCLFAGCGGGTITPRRIPANENLVTNGDIRATAPNSPERSLLHWWRAVQYGDLTVYLDFLSPSLRRQRTRDGRARSDLRLARGTFIPAKPEILSRVINGNHATVYTRIYVLQLVGASRTYTTSFPQAFSFVRTDGSWGLVDDLYIQQKANETAENLRQSRTDK